jgi:hypothetical protein
MIPILILAAVLSVFGGPIATDAGGGSPTVSGFGSPPPPPVAFDGGGGSPTHP